MSGATAQRLKLIGGLVVAGAAAGLAIHQSIFAEAHINDRLAQRAIFFALTILLGLLALRAAGFRGAGSGGHIANLPAALVVQKMTLVITLAPENLPAQPARFLCAL